MESKKILATPSDWESLLDEDNISNARKLGDKELKKVAMNQSMVDILRARCKEDLFFLARSVLGYTRLSENFHGDLCNWLMKTLEDRFRMLLLSRGHFKSTTDTISDSIRRALPYYDADNRPWPESLGVNIRILIAHESHGMASQFLYEITQHFVSNPMLMALFPECVPSRKIQRVNSSFLELPRSSQWKEATFGTMGVGTSSQGFHYNHLKLDDLIGEKARDSKQEMQNAVKWFDSVRAYFSTFSRDSLDVIGTRWAFDDLYNHVDKTYGSELIKYIRGAEHVVDGKLVPVFPEEYSSKDFIVMKKNKQVWSTQWANDPALGSTEFQASWKKYFNWNGPTAVRYRTPGNIISYVNTAEMDIVFLIDPAISGKAGFMVTGMDSTGNVFLLEALKSEWSPVELTDLVFQMVHKWRPRLVVVERVLFSAVFENYWKEAMKNRGTFFRVESLPVEGKSKDTRVRALSQYFAASQIYFHPDQKDILTEFDQFGATDDYHMLDALAMGPKVWRKGINTKYLQDIKDTNDRISDGSDGKSAIGGY